MSNSNVRNGVDILSGVFEWFNSLAAPGTIVKRADVERLFTPDMKMVANNQVKCVGLDAHYKHFSEIRNKLKSWHVRPFTIALAEGDKVAAYYLIDFVAADGSSGVIHDMAFWTVRDGKVASMTELVHFEGKEVALENH
jgi:hypothetical protein